MKAKDIKDLFELVETLFPKENEFPRTAFIKVDGKLHLGIQWKGQKHAQTIIFEDNEFIDLDNLLDAKQQLMVRDEETREKENREGC